jgi:tripartite-type tricarboxylate transporter receptor subunit TctC
MVSAFMLLADGGAVSAQTYPVRPVRLVTVEPGGGNDILARLTAQGLTGVLGQQVVVENRGGASGAIAAEHVARSLPDGHTLLFYSGGLWVLPLLQKVPYDTLKDFMPVTLVASSTNILAVHPSLPVQSVKELITLAKSRAGQLNYGSGGSGAASHLAAELFKSMTGVNIVRVPYKSAGPAIKDLLGGELQLMFTLVASGMPHVKAGRLRALAVTSAGPSALAPGLPTIAAAGVPGYEADSVFGVHAPVRTPVPVITRLNQEIVRFLDVQEFRERFFSAGAEPVGKASDEFANYIRVDTARLGKVIKDAGIRAD